jgi:hypothetical protein
MPVLGSLSRGIALGVAIVASVPARGADISDLLDQNWSAEDKIAWYESTQGSRLIPLQWLKSLEQAGAGQLPFLSDDHLRALRYLPRDMKSRNERLPLGFTVDASDDGRLKLTRLRWKAGQGPTEEWVGMTCAACHTAAISYKGATLTVDGGPTLADFQTFIEDLNKALAETKDDAAKFERFAKAVLRGEDNDTNRTMLQESLTQLLHNQQAISDLNKTDLRYGFGRLDAIGNILNKIAFVSGAPNPRANPADAPVSYPFLWNTPQHNFVEWNGLADNHRALGFDIGALGRNTGEVIGVFGDIETRQDPGIAGFHSSADVGNLVRLENLLSKLRPPQWPTAALGAPSSDAAHGVERGRKLYGDLCSNCHKLLSDRTDLDTPIEAHMSPLLPGSGDEPPTGTDPWMACNAVMFSGPTGNLKGLKVPLDGTQLDDTAQLTNMLAASVKSLMKWSTASLAYTIIAFVVKARACSAADSGFLVLQVTARSSGL